MKWSRITPIGNRPCATSNCGRPARWLGTAGDVGSDYCSECRDSIDRAEVENAACRVLSFDWSDNDADAVAAIERLRKAMRESGVLL